MDNPQWDKDWTEAVEQFVAASREYRRLAAAANAAQKNLKQAGQVLCALGRQRYPEEWEPEPESAAT